MSIPQRVCVVWLSLNVHHEGRKRHGDSRVQDAFVGRHSLSAVESRARHRGIKYTDADSGKRRCGYGRSWSTSFRTGKGITRIHERTDAHKYNYKSTGGCLDAFQP